MAAWRKKKGLRKRRGAASQARDSDSEGGEFEIQAEDDARARKVGAQSPDAHQGLSFPTLGWEKACRLGTGLGADRLRTCPGPIRGSGFAGSGLPTGLDRALSLATFA
jgi:hypothetical protein